MPGIGLLFHYDPACLNVFVSMVVQIGLPEFGTLLAHIWPKVLKPAHSKI